MVDVEKIKQLCKENGTSIKKIEKELGIGNGVIARWSKSNPNYDRLSKVANYFNVSVEYLTGTEEKPATNEGSGLSEEERKFIEWYRSQASEKDKALVRMIVEGEK